MKKIVLITGLLLIFSCKNENEKKPSVSSDSISVSKTEAVQVGKNLTSVEAIKEEFEFVNSLLLNKKLDSANFKYQCEERSGNVVYYSDKGVLKAIKHFEADSHFSAENNFFINEGKPYFIFTHESLWSFDGGTPEKPETKDDVTEKRFYIINEKAIQCLEKKYTLRSNSADNLKSENVANIEKQNCSIADLQKTFSSLLKNRNRKDSDVKCL